MMWKKVSGSLLLLLLLISPTYAQDGRQVWVYFFGWYTEDTWNDGRLADRPAIMRYKSYDNFVIGQQIQQAKSAGIDAFVMSWLGRGKGNISDVTLNIALDEAANQGFKIGVSVDLVGPDYLMTEEEVISEVTYLIKQRAHHPAYLRYNGKAVVYFWNQQRFSPQTWARIREQVDPTRDAIWISEGLDTSYLPTFDGLYLFNVAWSPNPAGLAQQYRNLTAQAGGTFFTPTVMPGWNEDVIAEAQNRPNPTSPRERGGGAFLRNSWAAATTANTNVILIVSWNEYFENSHIEPSEVHADTALQILQSLIGSWKAGAPVPPPQTQSVAEGSGEPVSVIEPGLPTGVTFTLGYTANMRSGPGTAHPIAASIPFQSTLDVIGRTGDSAWVQVNYENSSGWISLQLGTINGDMGLVPVTG